MSLPPYFTAQHAEFEAAQLNNYLNHFLETLQKREWHHLSYYIRSLNNCLTLRIPFTPQQRRTLIEAAWKFFEEPLINSHLQVKMAAFITRVLKYETARTTL
jgi:hypothetical protein